MIDLTTRQDRYGRPRSARAITGEDLMEPREGDLTADRKLYLDADGKPVDAKDPARATILAAEGAIIPRERAVELGLRVEDGKIAWGESKAKKADAEKAEAPAPKPAARKR